MSMNSDWLKLRKKGNKLYYLAHYAKKARVRKKNLRRVRAFEKKYNIPCGPIPLFVKLADWGYGSSAGSFAFSFLSSCSFNALSNKPLWCVN